MKEKDDKDLRFSISKSRIRRWGPGRLALLSDMILYLLLSYTCKLISFSVIIGNDLIIPIFTIAMDLIQQLSLHLSYFRFLVFVIRELTKL